MIPRMTSFACVLFMVIDYLGKSSGHTSPTKPCCWPSKLTGTMTVTTPEMHLFSVTFRADFDQGRSLDMSGEDSGLPFRFHYRDYKNKRRFLMFRDGTCQEYAMENEYVQCMPDDAKLVNTLQVTENGNVRDLHSWSFTVPNGGYQTRLVYGDNCHPFIYRLEDPMIGYKFENVVPRVDDYSVFDVDLSGCVKAD